jgi:hypothetical protein
MGKCFFMLNDEIGKVQRGTDHVGPVLKAFDMIDPVNIRFLQELPEPYDIRTGGTHQAPASLFV